MQLRVCHTCSTRLQLMQLMRSVHITALSHILQHCKTVTIPAQGSIQCMLVMAIAAVQQRTRQRHFSPCCLQPFCTFSIALPCVSNAILYIVTCPQRCTSLLSVRLCSDRCCDSTVWCHGCRQWQHCCYFWLQHPHCSSCCVTVSSFLAPTLLSHSTRLSPVHSLCARSQRCKQTLI